MKLNFILGQAGYGKTWNCFKEILARLAESPDGRPLLFIVPEQATYEVERALAAACPAHGYMRAHVLGFRRLAHRVLNETGGAASPHISELGKRMVFSRLLMENRNNFKLLSRAATEKGFAATVAGLVKEFKTYGVGPAAIDTVAARQDCQSNQALTAKMQDLALLYQGFEDFLAGRYIDPEDYLNLLAEKIPEASLLRQAEVWIDGFTFFTPQEYAVITAMLTAAQAVTVTLCLSDPDDQLHSQEEAVFHRQWETYHKLNKLALDLQAETGVQELTIPYRFASPVLQVIERQFFAARILGNPADADNGFTLAEAANRRTEAEAIAREIIRLSREEGLRWRDMAILIRDMDSYAELMATVLADYEIPFFSDNSRPAVHHPLAELVRSAFDVVRERWSYEPVFRCLKTDLFPVTRDQVDILENYCLEFGIRGTRWTSPEDWTFRRRYSLAEDEWTSDEADAAEQEYLRQINAIRRESTAALVSLAEKLAPALKQSLPPLALTQAVYEFLQNLQVADTLAEWAIAAETAGDLDQAREHQQMWPKLMEVFDQIVDTFAEQPLTLEEFAAVVSEGIEGTTLSLIPPGLDYVTIAALERTRRLTIKAAFIPGVNDGVLPQRRREEGLLNDSERALLKSLGLELGSGARADVFAEQFLVYTALSRASRYLWISYPLADAEGKALAPSPVVRRLKEITGRRPLSLPVEPPPGREAEYLARPKRTLAALAGAFRLYRETGQISPAWRDVYNWALAQSELRESLKASLAGLFHYNQLAPLQRGLAHRLYIKNGVLRGSVTRFEAFRACPFKHFAQYGLGLKERAVYQLAAPDLGQFLHAVLKVFGDRLAAENQSWGALADNEISNLCGDIVAQLAPKLQNEILLSSKQHEHLVIRLTRRAVRAVSRLAAWDRVTQFHPVAFEQAFGRGADALPPLRLTLPAAILEVAGQIDRLDITKHNGQNYVLVIDYKSGGAWLTLAEVYYGLKLQLLTYLLVAVSAGHEPACLPAGILYYFLKNPVIAGTTLLAPEQIEKGVNSRLKMPGWLLADTAIAGKLDGTLQGWSEFFKIALGKNGFYENCMDKLKTAEEFQLLLCHVKQELIEVAAAILDGENAIRPYRLGKSTPCGYCALRPVCQFDGKLPENEYFTLPKLADETIMNELRQRKGGGE
ncbi:helicase-exonuclease AddAB subunit AddB [Sporomusa acidovorans]|uniref:ATP-dependent helicase/deoxyribonuclease subunit B n=1 Tax=Sporomusa acidovorans (strain ATCC 49682 / DSM 3132 / Mol) TaxID=1123286 RepID=A0ABZ3IWA4_SPOA4|nr:helicase-exonuclease AddAB subunit AddB [Sporomusa acidovorans]OZC15263.1 ATP-dependent helicase/deoxyribonuclease subunit B [Sporomusa acidovorans DSM 3132]SDE91563.1 DNA helicase/exodeoxyribonuclease V, subunit B [Sporomusa acidovorans]